MKTWKIYALLLPLLILCCALIFALSEGGGHTPSAEWYNDVEGHWHACLDADCTEHLDFAPHSPETDDSDCSTAINCAVCDWELTAADTHNPVSDWQTDATGHWHACQNAGCTVKLNFAAHTPNPDDGDCTTHILCSVCNAETTPAKTHDPSVDWQTDATGHWHTCKNAGCIQHLSFAAHTPNADDGNCETPILCSVCGEETTSAKTHDPSTDWQKDAEGHWHTCKNAGCTQHLSFAAHTPNADDGNCETPILCSVCGEETTSAKPHDPSADWQTDAEGHWHACKNAGCTVKLSFAAHTPNADDGNCETPILCSICDAETTSAKTHDPSTDWQKDAEGHWHTCQNAGCTQRLDFAAHTPEADDGNCETPILCSICDAETTSAKTHDPAADWQTDAEGHWHACKNAGCTVKLSFAAHTPNADDGNCETPILCSICDAETTSAKTHDPSADWQKDAEGHWHTCQNAGCTQRLSFAAHTPEADDGNCETPILCSVCDAETTSAKTHDPSTDWQKDAEGHWYTCQNAGCTQRLSFAAHTPEADDGNCETPILCSVCGEETTAAKTHDPSADWQTDAEGHWHTCKNAGCTVKLDSAAHTPNADDGNCETAILCSICNAETTAAKTHNKLSKWTKGPKGHWHACKNKGCKEKFDFAEHTLEEDDLDCTTPVLCEVCKRVCVAAKSAHSFRSGANSSDYVFDDYKHELHCLNKGCYKYTGAAAHVKIRTGANSFMAECTVCDYEKNLADELVDGCYLANGLFTSNSPQAWTFRAFRDNTLSKSAAGRFVIKTYYAISPVLIDVLGESELITQFNRSAFNSLATYLQSRGYSSAPYDVSALTASGDSRQSYARRLSGSDTAREFSSARRL